MRSGSTPRAAGAGSRPTAEAVPAAGPTWRPLAQFVLLSALALVAVFAVAGPARVAAQTPADLRPSDAHLDHAQRAFGDTTLARLIAAALDGNRDLRAVEARVRAARAHRTDAALQFTPAITASAGYTRQRLSTAAIPGAAGRLPDQDLWEGSLQLSWEVDVFGRIRRSVQGRNALLASAEHDVRDVRLILSTEVARVYFDLRGAQDRLAVARQNAENQRRTLGITTDRLDAGTGTALDSERASAQLSMTLAEIPVLESAIAAHMNRLAVLLGRTPAAFESELQIATGPVPELPLDIDVADAEARVRQRPDIVSAASRVEARRAMRQAATAAYLPRLSVGAVAGFSASRFDALGNSGTPQYLIGPVISWPFLDLGRVRAGVDVARAEEAEAAARYDQAVLSGVEEARTAAASYRKARERLRHLEDAAAASERATSLARLRFEEGGTDFLEVLDAERRQLEAQDRLAVGRTQATEWLLAIYRATGGDLSTGLR